MSTPEYEGDYEKVSQGLAVYLENLLHIPIKSMRENPRPLRSGEPQEPFWCVYSDGVRLTRPGSVPRTIVFASLRRTKSEGDLDQVEIYNEQVAHWIKDFMKATPLLESVRITERRKSGSWRQNIH